MRKPGTDSDHVQMSDVLCDFCGAEWTDTLPMVEGHQGSTICGRCLADAYRAVVLRADAAPIPGARCSLCLEERKEPMWRREGAPALVCQRCIKQSAAVLAKDKDLGWEKPRA